MILQYLYLSCEIHVWKYDYIQPDTSEIENNTHAEHSEENGTQFDDEGDRPLSWVPCLGCSLYNDSGYIVRHGRK